MSKKEKVKATVDVHEPGKFIKEVTDHPETTEVKVDQLDSADLVIEGDYGFERKTPSDFASSMTEEDNRLRDQVERMVEDYERAWVLIEGNADDFENLVHTDVKPESLHGFASSIEVRDNVPVKFCARTDIMVDMAVRRSRKMIEDPSAAIRLKSSADKQAPVAMRMMGCIEGIGPHMAEKLYEKYGSISELEAAVETGDVEDVDGVGPATVDRIRDAL